MTCPRTHFRVKKELGTRITLWRRRGITTASSNGAIACCNMMEAHRKPLLCLLPASSHRLLTLDNTKEIDDIDDDRRRGKPQPRVDDREGGGASDNQ